MNLRSAALLALFLSAPVTAAPGGDTDTAVQAIEAARAQVPEFDGNRRADQAYVEAFVEEQKAALDTLSARILELYELAPEHEALVELMPERWSIRAQQFDEADETMAEIEKVVAANPGGDLASSGRFWSANIAVNHRTSPVDYHFSFDVADQHVRNVLAKGEDDVERIGWLLRSLGDRAEEGSARQLELYKLLVNEYGDASSARGVDSALYQLERVGKPFELAFTDAISGNEITMAGLAGKVVVVDFWATWCGPCIREMPHMKELYERFHDQGVEFVGISLDSPPEEGGLEKLKAYVAANDIPWPQYYQGGGWQSEFSSAWKVQSIPALFVVDADGNLASVNARGRLEEILPGLLAKRAE